MKKQIIKTGHHYPHNFILPTLYFIEKQDVHILREQYKFTDSCFYNFENEDQYDVNKLFGISIGYHHINSFRFGWRPLIETKEIEIVAYEYRNKIRVPTIHICNILPNIWYDYTLTLNNIDKTIEYEIYNVKYRKTCGILEEKIDSKTGIGYKCNLYFGGNKTAPHDIEIYKRDSL